ncbi:response regulator transcription factor [Acidimicrobiia bacterium EGI L10123]|uniref:LuxR C-terminal-related transcriptional regulator n=1 Tax=Salinilacustrithrix flava TaxID=2957203 RepID=UPI003D7C20B9|nr:response regulator transcription factor [Acidimicrobiia bacterium EGI L10123]
MSGIDGPGGPTDVTVVVLEDHEMVASALEAVLDQDPRLRVVGTTSRLEDALRVVAERSPTVLVTDLRLDGVEIADQLGRFVETCPDVRILVVTGWATERTLFDSLDHGAHGFIGKSQGLDELVDAVVRVADGETVVAPQLLPALVRRTSHRSGRDRTNLTPRELEVLRLLAEGTGTREMAEHLAVSPNTIRNHVRAVLGKLGASSRLEAVTIARRMDLIAPVET